MSISEITTLCLNLGEISAGSWLFGTLRISIILLIAGYAFRRRSLTVWIQVGMLSGAEFGHDFPATAVHLQFLATIFLRLIKTIIAPLLFSTLIVGIAGHTDLKKVGRMAVKSMVYFQVISTLAMLIGFAAIRISRAGVGIHLHGSASDPAFSAMTYSFSELLTNVFPENIAKSIAEGQILQVVVFSVLFAVALAMLSKTKQAPLLAFAESLSETMFKFTNIVMLFAPVGVFGAVAYTIGHMGLDVLLPLSKLILTLYVALIVFVLLVLLPVILWSRIPLRQFVRAALEPFTIAFATASSEAALPRAMEQMESLGIAREAVAFVMAAGFSFNLDGSSLYQSLAVIFVAQAAGLPLTLGQQAMMLLALAVSSKGTAGVARASLIIVLGVAASFHLPMEPVMILLGIDQIMDMGRAAISVLGNCVATVVIARWEGEINPFQDRLAALIPGHTP